MDQDRGEALRSRFAEAERSRAWPNQVPRDAATLIVIDRATARPKILMGRRHHGHKFMPGKFVFPGGRLEPGDRRMSSVGAMADETAAALENKVVQRSKGRGRALALAAIRETYEETGLMIGAPATDMPGGGPDGIWAAFRAHGVAPDLSAVSFIGRAITPTRRPKRFDTRFFAIDRGAIAREEPGVVGPDSELVELVWVDLEAAQELDLPRITSIMLEELEARIEAGMDPGFPVPFYFERHGRFRRELL